MKNNKFNVILLLIGLFILTCAVLSLNDEIVKINFLADKKNFFWDNYFLAATAMYFIYACVIEDLIKRNEEILITRVFKIIFGGLFFSVALFEYGIVKEFLIALNIVIITFNYKRVRLLTVVIPLMIALAFFSEYAINIGYQHDFNACQKKILNDNDAENCIIEFGFYNRHTEQRTYLTQRNIELAKKNEKIKQLIEKNVIEKNNDENCKLNENYDVPNIRTKRGIPCMG